MNHIIFQNNVSEIFNLLNKDNFIENATQLQTSQYDSFENLWSNILHKIPIVMFVFNSDKCIWVNNSIYTLLGYTMEEVLNRKSYDLKQLLHKDDLNKITNNPSNQFIITENGTMFATIEARILNKSGNWHWVLVYYVINEINQQLFYSGVMIDINERREKENQKNIEMKFIEQNSLKHINLLKSKIYCTNHILDTVLAFLQNTQFDKFQTPNLVKDLLIDATSILNSDELLNECEMFQQVFSELSKSEKRVFRLSQARLSNKNIAELLNLSVRTVESHKYKIRRKFSIIPGFLN